MHVPPSDFDIYRANHDFQAPCCLCAIDTVNTYTKCAIFVDMKGLYAGEYVAGCAYDRCGYLGT